jgi:hypothetical protein
MIIKNIPQSDPKEEEEEEFVPVSEADIIEQERKLEEKQKKSTPVANFLNSIIERKREEKVLVEQFEKPEVPVPTENDQIEELVEIALTRGVEKAIEIAKKSRSPYVIDAFHDRLIEEIKERKTKE